MIIHFLRTAKRNIYMLLIVTYFTLLAGSILNNVREKMFSTETTKILGLIGFLHQ
jgi:hypothetical protein